MGHPAFEENRFTYGEVRSWTGEERYELIEGALHAMAPAPLLEHQDVVGRVYAQLLSQLEGHPCRPFIVPVDVRLPEPGVDDDATTTVVQPDVFVVCDAQKLDARGVRGAPDFVVEVLSPATASRDHVDKKRLYERVGVREYWIVHPTDRLLTLYRRGGAAFGAPEIVPLEGVTNVESLSGLVVRWEPIVRALAPHSS